MDPFSIAMALSLMLGGTYFKSHGMNKITAEQGRLADAERVRQGQLDQQRIAAVNNTLPQLGRGGQEQQQQSIAQKLAAYYTPPTDAKANDYQAQNPGAPQEIKARQEAAVADATQKGRDYAARLADMSSYNLLNFGNSAQLGRVGENVSNITRSQINSSQILPFELQAATRAGQRDMLLADLSNGAASIAAMYGMRGDSTKLPVVGQAAEFGPGDFGPPTPPTTRMARGRVPDIFAV